MPLDKIGETLALTRNTKRRVPEAEALAFTAKTCECLCMTRVPFNHARHVLRAGFYGSSKIQYGALFLLPLIPHLRLLKQPSLCCRRFATMSTTERVADKLEKPALDDRSYRVIRLPNRLEALLVHDPDTDKASASVNVNVGSFSDADDMPGMAHAVEHLLFMGTEKVYQFHAAVS